MIDVSELTQLAQLYVEKDETVVIIKVKGNTEPSMLPLMRISNQISAGTRIGEYSARESRANGSEFGYEFEVVNYKKESIND